MSNENIKKVLSSPYTVAMVFFLFFVALYLYFYYGSASSKVAVANENYHTGEQAVSVASRKADFNKALDIYLSLEESYQPTFGNGKLYYNIGNTYFQIGEYPMAALYYYRALYLRPYDSRAMFNLKVTLKKLGLPPPKKNSVFARIFFFHALLPLPRRLQVFFFLSLAAFILASIYLWRPLERIKLSAIITGALASLMLLSFGYTYYFENASAVIVEGTSLYRGAGKHFATVGDQPLKPGSKVEVFQSELEGSWLKVETEDGNVGFIPNESLKVIFYPG